MTKEPVEVIQEDRNAAVRLLEAGGQDWQAKEIRLQQADHWPIVQALARHRLSHSAEKQALIEALRKVVAGFRESLTNGERNRETHLTINHDELRALVEDARSTLLSMRNNGNV
jgi:hypothetical protein